MKTWKLVMALIALAALSLGLMALGSFFIVKILLWAGVSFGTEKTMFWAVFGILFILRGLLGGNSSK